MVEINPYYDDVILGDSADPAYAVREIPIAQSGTETAFAPATDPRPASDLDSYAFNEFNKLIDQSVLPVYQKITGKTLEENFGKDILARQLSMAQAFQEAGLPLDPNKTDVTSAEMQSNILGPLLQKYGYKKQSPSEGLERTVEFFFRDQREAREKRLRGETLTPMEEIMASPPMAILDAFDITGLISLGLKGAFKASRAGLKYLLGESAKGTSKDVALKNFAELFPEDTKALQMSAVENQRLTIGGASTPTVLKEAEKGSGLTSSTPTKLDPETKAKRDQIFEEKRKVREQEIIENAKKFETKDEAVAASGLSKSRFNTVLRNNNLTAADLGLKVGKRGTPDTSAAKKKVLDDFLAANPDKKFTRSELAEATGFPKSYVKDPRSYQTDASNLVTHKSKVAEEYDERIRGMNELLKDLKSGKTKDGFTLDVNMGPEYYQKLGYKIDVDKIKKGYLEFPKIGQYETLMVEPRDLAGIIGTRSSDASKKINNLQNYLNVNQYKPAATELAAKKIMLRDYYRGLSPEGKTEFDRLIMDPEAFGFLPKKIMKDGLPVDNEKLFTKQGQAYQKQSMNNLLGAIEAVSGGPQNVKAIQKMQADKKILNAYADEKFFNLLQNNKALQERFVSEANRVGATGLKKGKKPIVYNNWNDAYEAFKDMFHGQLSHVVSSKHLGTPKDPFKKAPKFEGKKQFAGLMRINFANHNVSLQPRIENVVDRNVKKLTKNPMDEKALEDIATADVMLKERGMLTYMRFTNKEMSEKVFKKLQGFFGPRQVFKEGGRKTIILGQPGDPTVDQLKRYLDNRFTDYENNPNTFKLSAATPEGQQNKFEDVMMETGDNDYIAKGFLTPKSFEKGGPVRMAMGGDPLTNLNQQQFAPDPAFEGEDYFQQAVDSGNLYAFNPTKLFKLFGKVDGVQTPKKITEPEAVDAPAGTTLPATQVIQPQDFPFRSYTLEAIMDPNAPKAATPQAWADFLVKGKKSPVSELQDSGLEQYLRDFESYFPNQKITQTQLIDYYETSPIGNLSFKVKEDSPVRLNQDPAYSQYSGSQKHKQAGNQPLDEIGSEYREIVVEAGPLPGETRPYVQSGHYSEPNVIGFTRVANYTGKDGNPIAVIQEMQTDMLTTVRKEQERLQALLGRIKNYKASAEQKLQSASEYDISMGQQMLQTLNQTYPPTVMKTLEENQNLIKPFPNEAGKELIPGFSADIQNLQKQIDAAVKADIAQTNPETGFLLTQINNQQMEVLNKLQDLNRSGEIDQILGGIKVPQTAETEDLARIASDPNPATLVDGFSYGQKDLTLFPPIPFNKQPDYVDLLLKATIKDAQSKGINKVAIYPADLVNRRWNKTPGSPEGKKFEDLYGKVAIQQMKNIAKKYGGTAQFEVIMDPTKASKGLRYYNRNIDGNKFDILKEEVPRPDLSEREVQPFFDEQIKRMVEGEEDFRVALTREIAPGQTMDYFVLNADNDKGYILQPFKQGDELEDAQIVIEEFNPQEIKMFTVTLDSPQAEQPMYLFKKKSGGSIDKDSLVSITDIYGEYGR